MAAVTTMCVSSLIVSLQCIVMQTRLLFAASVIRHGTPHLLDMLASHAENADKAPLPCVKAVMKDLQQILDFHRNKLYELGPPEIAPCKWMSFMLDYPYQWKQLVKSTRFTSMELDIRKSPTTCILYTEAREVAFVYIMSGFIWDIKGAGIPLPSKAQAAESSVRNCGIVNSLPCVLCEIQYTNTIARADQRAAKS